MQAIQKQKLRPAVQKAGNCTLDWHDILDDIPSEPDIYTMLIAHEFFDALPVNVIQVMSRDGLIPWVFIVYCLLSQKSKDGWHEVLIDDASKPTAENSISPTSPLPAVSGTADSSTSPSKRPFTELPSPPTSRFRLVLSPPSLPTATILALSSPRYQAVPIETPIEVSHASFKVARKIGEVLGGKGCALIVDYGGEKAYGDSFRVSFILQFLVVIVIEY